MSNSLAVKPVLVWAVRLLSFAAMVVCLVLFGMKVTGAISSVAGCGGEGGCSQVMGGPWSEWFHIPVTLGAAVIYAGVLLLTLQGVQRALGRTGDQLLAAAGVILAGAAVYFLSLLYIKERGHCPWCLGLHITGLAVAAVILTNAVKSQRAGERGLLEAAMLTGVMAIGLLAAGQVWGPKPESHVLTAGTLSDSAREVPESGAMAGPRVIRFAEGALNLSFEVEKLPLLGAADAPVVLVEYFDYTCGSCRNLAEDLAALKQKWPGTFAVVAMPSPLNRECNPLLKSGVDNHPGACELARLSLELWRAKPSAFAEFHEFLLRLPLPVGARETGAARAKAVELAGVEAMAVAGKDSWVDSQMLENIGTLAKLQSERIVMPKLLVRSRVIHGLVNNAAALILMMEQEYCLTTRGAPGGNAQK